MDLSELKAAFQGNGQLEEIWDRYDVREKLGEGGFGSVFRARSIRTGHEIAIKVIKLKGPGGTEERKSRGGAGADSDASEETRVPAVEETATVADLIENAEHSFDENALLGDISQVEGAEKTDPGSSGDPSSGVGGDENTGRAKKGTDSGGSGERSSSGTTALEGSVRESYLLARMSHPALPRFHEVVSAANLFVLVMEYIEGETLQRLFREGAWMIAPERGVETIAEALEILEYVHSNGVLHLDLKPSNLMRDGSGRLRILDFGAAGLIRGALAEGTIHGTPRYLSPEHTSLTGYAPGTWSDLYTIGVMLYEATCGVPLFEACDTSTLIEAHLKREPTPPREVNSDLHPYLEKIILRLLEKNPNERYQTASGVLKDLEFFLEQADNEPKFTVGTWDKIQQQLGNQLYGGSEDVRNVVQFLQQDGGVSAAIVEGPKDLNKQEILREAIEHIEGYRLPVAFVTATNALDDNSILQGLLAEVVQSILTLPQEQRKQWKEHFRRVPADVRRLGGKVPRLLELLPREYSLDEERGGAPEAFEDEWQQLLEFVMSGPQKVVFAIGDAQLLRNWERNVIGALLRSGEVSPSSAAFLIGFTPGARPRSDEWIEEVRAHETTEYLELSGIDERRLKIILYGVLRHSEQKEFAAEEIWKATAGRTGRLLDVLEQLVGVGAMRREEGRLVADPSRFQLEALPRASTETEAAVGELTEEQTRVLSDIALFDEGVPAGLVETWSERNTREIRQTLAKLNRTGFLHWAPEPKEARIRVPEQIRHFVITRLLDYEQFYDRLRLISDRLEEEILRGNIDGEDLHRDSVGILATSFLRLEQFEAATPWLLRKGMLELEGENYQTALQYLKACDRHLALEGSLDKFYERTGLLISELIGDAYLGLGSDAEAVSNFERALERTRRCDEIAVDDDWKGPTSSTERKPGRDRNRVLSKLSEGLRNRQRYDDAEKRIVELMDSKGVQLPRGESELKRGLVVQLLKFAWLRLIHHLRILPVWQRGLSESDELDQREIFDGLNLLIQVCVFKGKSRLMFWLHLFLLNRAMSLGEPELLSRPYASHAAILLMAPRQFPSTASKYIEKAIEYAEQSEDPESLALAGSYAQSVALWRGDFEKAVLRNEQYEPHVVEIRAFYKYQIGVTSMAYLDIYTGNIESARRRILRFMMHAHDFGTFDVGHVTTFYLGYISYVRGEYEGASEYLRKGREINEVTGDESYRCRFDWIDFKLKAREGDLEEAVALARESVERLDEIYIDAMSETLCRAIEIACRALTSSKIQVPSVDEETVFEWVDEALSRTENRPSLRPLALIEKARVTYELRDDVEKSLDLVRDAIHVALELQELPFAARAFLLKGELERKENQPFNAAMALRQSASLFEESGWVGKLDEVNEERQKLRKNAEALSGLYLTGN